MDIGQQLEGLEVTVVFLILRLGHQTLVLHALRLALLHGLAVEPVVLLNTARIIHLVVLLAVALELRLLYDSDLSLLVSILAGVRLSAHCSFK